MNDKREGSLTSENHEDGKEQKGSKKNREENEKSEKHVLLPIQQPGYGGSIIGTAECIEENGVLFFQSLNINGNVGKRQLLDLANRLGILELDKGLDNKGIWADNFTLILKCNFSDRLTAPRVFSSKHGNAQAPVALEDQLFDKWRHSGKADVKIDQTARPPKIEFILD